MSTSRVIRVIDLILSSIFLILTSPLLLLISILIKISDSGDIFADNSNRVGRYGVLFKMYKFRTMIPNAHNEILTNEKYSKYKEEWINTGKILNSPDPRVTTVGRILRYFDLDELPQFLNVLKGDMSIVGARPWFEEELKRNLKIFPAYSRKYNDIALSIAPGITGLWQINGRNNNHVTQRFEYDIKYAKERNLFLYIWVIIATPFVIVKKIIKGGRE